MSKWRAGRWDRAMPARRRLAAAAVAVMVGATGLLVGGAAPAAAGCEQETYYTIKAKSIRMKFKGVPTFKNGPGGRMTVTKHYSGSVSYGVELGVESEVGAVLAKAKASLKVNLVKTNSTGSTNAYSKKISKGKYGNAKYVSYGKRVSWTKKQVRANCTVRTIRSGVIKFPASKEGWYYWETKS